MHDICQLLLSTLDECSSVDNKVRETIEVAFNHDEEMLNISSSFIDMLNQTAQLNFLELIPDWFDEEIKGNKIIENCLWEQLKPYKSGWVRLNYDNSYIYLDLSYLEEEYNLDFSSLYQYMENY
jgi:hypothetical protein